MKNLTSLPSQTCKFGYTVDQLNEILGKERADVFVEKMERLGHGAICDGRQWIRGLNRYVESCGGVAHGDVYYYSDLREEVDGSH